MKKSTLDQLRLKL